MFFNTFCKCVVSRNNVEIELRSNIQLFINIFHISKMSIIVRAPIIVFILVCWNYKALTA